MYIPQNIKYDISESSEDVGTLCEVVEGLYEVVSSFGKQTSVNTVLSTLLKTVSRLSQANVVSYILNYNVII